MTPDLRFKHGVTLTKLSPQMTLAAIVIANTYALFNRPCVVTSGDDSKHKRDSLHGTGNALDFRTNNCTPQQAIEIAKRAQEALGENYQVIVEPDHLHVEFDPPHHDN